MKYLLRNRPAWSNSNDNSNNLDIAKEKPISEMYEGKLRTTGRVQMGLCPFHEEHTASFAIYPENNTWHCFAEGIGGDSISFYMKKTGVSFMGAVRELSK